MSIPELYSLFKESGGITTDTRNIFKNNIFFALKGSQFNANAFAEEALKAGCSYAVIDEEEYFVEGCILVENVLESLQELAKYHREQLRIPIIGITGSNGKTTTKELLNAVLSKKYKVKATPGNFNNHIGVPLTLLSIGKEIEIAIIEMGANHAGEIAFLCEISQPNYGAITSIGMAHIEGFGSLETIIDTKCALYRFLEKNNGIAFVDSNNQLLVEKSANNKRILFGSNDNCYSEIIHSSSPFLEFNLKIKDKESHRVCTQLIGDYNLDNIMIAISIGLYFDIDIKAIVEAIEEYAPSNNRSQWMESANNKLILDAYNANPSSIKSAIENFRSLQLKNKVIILGDMLELGEIAKEEHQKVIEMLLKEDMDVYLVGPIYSSCLKTENMHFFSNTADAKSYFSKNRMKSKTILIKGSRGLKLESLVEDL